MNKANFERRPKREYLN